MPGKKSFKFEILLLITILIWGINMPVLKAALSQMPIFLLNAFRFVVSAVVLGIIYGRQIGWNLSGISSLFRSHGIQIGLFGTMTYVFYQLCFIMGVSRTAAGSAALIMASSPMWTAFVARAAGHETLRPKAWLGLIVSALGTVAVTLGSGHAVDFSSEVLLGNGLLIIAAALWGSYTALTRPLLQKIAPISLSFWGLMVSLPFIFLFAIPQFDVAVIAETELSTWAAIVFSGGLSTGLTFVIWMAAVKALGASHTAVYNNLTPFVAVAAGYLLLGEKVFPMEIVGGVLIIAGLLLMRTGRDIEVIPEA